MKNKILIVLLLITYNSYALLKIDINKKNINSIPIAVVDFANHHDIATTIKNDLTRSGRFKVMIVNNQIDFDELKKTNIEAVVYGEVKNSIVKFYLYDIWRDKILLAQKIKYKNTLTRTIYHYISNNIYDSLLGEKGYFNTRITYISINDNKKLKYNLEIADADGNNTKVLFSSKEPLLSPVWSPDNKKIAYVSFKNYRSQVYIQYLYKRLIIKLPSFDGISSSPSWSPDGKSLLLTLSKDGNKDIYQYNLDGKLKRITKNSAIDTEASFSPDGKYIIWTSNRLGGVQIYSKNLNNNHIKKITNKGSYNADASFSPDGKLITFVHKENDKYKIAVLNIYNNDFIILTDNALDESPSFSPNGKLVIFTSKKYDRNILSVAAVDVNYSFNISTNSTQIRDPNWSN